MPPRRPRTEDEVEAEVQSFGLTNEGAAAIVRLGNTLKGARKLQREHAKLLALGRRLHPPSPLSQSVWKQADIEDSSLPELEAGIRGLRLEDAHDEQTEIPDASVEVNEIPLSQEPATLKPRRRALSPIQEEEEEEEEKKEREREQEKGGEDDGEKEKKEADSSEGSSAR